MPLKVTNAYAFTGPISVVIYTEHEMSAVLELTRDELIAALERGEYKYHVHPSASGSGTPGHYQFTERVFRENIERKAKRDRADRSASSSLAVDS